MASAPIESMIGLVEDKSEPEKPVDREKTLEPLESKMDATLREITSLVKEVNPEARRKGTYFDFSLVFPDMRSPGYRMREIGTTCSGQRNVDDGKTLAQARFCIGDYMDISITPPNRMMPMMRRGGRPY
ncbi:Histone deacetylase complex subunit SAP18 [Blattella germanica]|nr:Histone deacetylase complex subunit SAP18 [Blattella germanica]